MNAWEFLEHAHGRFGLICGPDSEAVAVRLARSVGIPISSVGTLLTEGESGISAPEAVLRGRRVLTDLDVLFWPAVPVDPLRLLRTLARNTPLLAVWPGDVVGERARYSEPGRPDHYDQTLPAEAVILRARPTTFPDELAYEVERI